jgi:GT2 family glycosyltransferase
MHNTPLVSVQIVVRNGERYIRHCLDAVSRQTYPNLEVIVLDNASTDGTADIVAREYPQYRLFRHTTNMGMWPGQEYVLAHSTGEYIISLSVDVLLDREFATQAVAAMRSDDRIGAVQGKVYQYVLAEFAAQGSAALNRDIIDTCGFALMRSRKVVNIGHGLHDDESLSRQKDIFGVEGAVPCYRRSALLQCAVDGMLWDADYFWYGDDLDMAWRMNLFGFRQVLAPSAVAWHDRSTTKGAAVVPVLGQLKRRAIRARIPLAKRRLDWSNVRFTIIKNDYIINVLRDIPWILARELATLVYTVIFEPGVLREAGRFFSLMPRMLRRRRQIMRRAVTPARHIHRWFL